MSSPVIGLDIETTGLDPYSNQIISVQLANGHNNTVDVIDARKDNFDFFFKEVFSKYAGILCIQNALFDLKFLRHFYGILYFDLYDTQLGYQLIKAGLELHKNLKLQTKQYLGIELDKGVRNEFTLPLFYNVDLTPEQLRYAALDAWVLPRIREKQLKEVAEAGLEKSIWLENAVVPAFVKAELAGMVLDVDAWTKITEEEQAKADTLAARLRSLTTPTFNPNSSQQVIAQMEAHGLHVPVVYGKQTTKEEFIKDIDHPFIQTLLEYRTAKKRVSTYGKEFLGGIHPVTGKLHTSFNQLGTVTGRVSSDSPNFQNIPKKEDGKKYRACFIAGEGFKLVAADFTGQEIMVMAEASQDQALIAIYEEGLDRHQKTASDLFGVPYDAVTPDQRKIAKTFNFGVSYGSSAWNMANKLHLPLEFVEKKLDDYWRVYSTLQKWQRRAGLIALRDGFSETFWGRRRYYPDLSNKGAIMRQGANHVIQGTSADMTKYATYRIDQELEKRSLQSVFVNFVHDEAVLRAPDREVEEAAYLVKEQMELAGTEFVKVIPQRAEVNVGDYWM